MKYISTFELFEGYNKPRQVKSYLSEIFLELEDDGYNIDIEGRWMRTFNTEELTGFRIKINGKNAEENVIPAIETSINYMSTEGFNRYWIMVENYGQLTMSELSSYFNLRKSLVNPPKISLELNFRK